MAFEIGEAGLGEYARSQIEAARRDPRLAREDGDAMIADFWDSVEEAERVRSLMLFGLDELVHALEREEVRLGVKRTAQMMSPEAAASLQAAWERAEAARAELLNDSPHSNAQALISLNSALDAMVERLVHRWRTFQVEHIVKDVVARGVDSVAEAEAVLTPELRGDLIDAVRQEIDEMVPKPLRLRGSGANRYEKPLSRIGFAAPADRPIPADLDTALTELGALRDVLVHRAGRVDERALSQAPTLSYAVGEFVRLSGSNYRTYSAAVCCYAQEVSFRGIRNWPEVTDADGPNLEDWRSFAHLNS